MSRTNKLSLLLALTLAVGMGLMPTFARDPTSSVSGAAARTDGGLDPTLKSALTPGFLENKIKETESVTDLDDAAKAKLTEQYRKALSSLEAASALDTKAATFKQALETAPREAQAIRERLAAA